MRTSFFVLASTLVFATSSAFAADGTFDKTLSVSGATTLSIESGSGYIHVFPGPDSQVHVIGHVHGNKGWLGGNTDAKVREIVANPPIEQSGSGVTVGGNHSRQDLFQNISIDYDVTAPRMATLNAHTGSGDLKIGGMEGTVTGGSGSGDVLAENIGANARLETGSGSIHASKVHGGATVQTGSGNLLLDVDGSGDVKAHTGSGSIRVHGLAGGLRASAGSGSIEVQGTPTGDWRVETGSGDVNLQLAAGAKFTLNADTGSGSIHVDQPILMQGSMDHHHFSGSVNGGGSAVHASTGSGDISVR